MRNAGDRIIPEFPEVAVCDIDAPGNRLIGADGRSSAEADPNTWVPETGFRDVVYLGTGRHGGGVVLRPLFVKRAGVWINVSTGKPAPSGVSLPTA